MLRGTYIGAKRCKLIEHDDLDHVSGGRDTQIESPTGDVALKGFTALLREIPGDTVNIEAQFDNMNLEHAFSWHRYRRSEFEIAAPEPEETIVMRNGKPHFEFYPQ